MINALNGEREFSANSSATDILPYRRYWFLLRVQAETWKKFFPGYCVSPEADYRKAQDAFMSTLRDLVEKIRELDWDWNLCLTKHYDMKLAITRFVGRPPRLGFHPVTSGPSLSKGRPTYVRISPLLENVMFRSRKDRPGLRARRHAIGLFLKLAWHPQCDRLGKCQRCGRYFFGRPGQKCCPRPRRCGSYLAAIRATKERWRETRQNMLTRAQEAITQWELGGRRMPWKPWVAKRVGKTEKWLTRAVNHEELTPPQVVIESSVGGRPPKKGKRDAN